MDKAAIIARLEASPVIAAVKDKLFESALRSPADVIFLFGADIMTVEDRIRKAHDAGKFLFIHIDLTEGIGKDKAGLRFLSACGADGILSTKASLIRMAKELQMVAVQRFFAYDSQGVESIDEVLRSSTPDIIEIMPGVIDKIIRRFSSGSIPLIAGGLIQTKQEVTAALRCGAIAVSTGKQELWSV